MSRVGLRVAEPADAQRIAEVHVASWRVAYRDLIPAAVLDGLSVEVWALRWAETLYRADPGKRTIVAVDGSAVLGLASVGPARDGPVAGELYALYLLPASWGSGVGRRLHAAALRELRACGAEQALLWVLDGNERASRFYRRAGWAQTGRSKRERGPGGVELGEDQMFRCL